jgi:class 3 adenylate cyclase
MEPKRHNEKAIGQGTDQPNPGNSASARTCSAKYVFLDVVKFTHQRNVEAQSHIVDVLIVLVLSAIKKYEIYGEGTCIFIPTGDGLCIALMNTEGKYDFDIHMSIALDILGSLHACNSEQPDEMKRFQIRIGINANEDNLIKDINGRDNLAGAGISLASRIMDKADGGQVLIGDSVFDKFQQREKYMDKFNSFRAVDKHGKRFRIHQYIDKRSLGLNTDTPSAFAAKLNRTMAYYLAHAIKNKEFILRAYRESTVIATVVQVLLYLLAKDSEERATSSGFSKPFFLTWNAGVSDFAEQLQHYGAIDQRLIVAFYFLVEQQIEESHYDALFENTGMNYLFVNAEGTAKVKEEFPDIWKEFELDK